MTTLDKFLMTVTNKNNVLSAVKSTSLVFVTSEFPEKRLIIQSVNTVLNYIKGTQNTQEMFSNTLS